MFEELDLIYSEIKGLKENLIKLNKSRRTEKILNEKLNEATLLYSRYLSCADDLDSEIRKGTYKNNDIIYSKEICIRIESLYSKIEEFCNSNIEKLSTMSNFDLKTAVALLPEMNDKEEVTKKLIDAIELYNSMLNADGKSTLINFILKTRLSESAKLRLASSYTSCELLLSDMKKHLLTQMSSTAIHTQLIKENQNTSTIEDYGKRLESLFVNLTISQADGNSASYEVLRPINEKLAIKSFIDGLRNANLRVILAARNYSSLKDVIRAAKDEELSSYCSRSQSEGTIFSGQHQRKSGNFNRSFRGGRRGFSGRQGFRGGRGAGSGQYQPRQQHQNPGTSRQVSYGRGRTFHRGSTQGMRWSNNNTYRGNQTRQIHFMNSNNERQSSHVQTTAPENTSENDFFRA
ncbi:hypothetical protein ABMA27_001732 [Loxostege sticticalis]|uniref:Retrotransposon gag domain-containing protein n=1 Tax=Loxostege sticticalis TaxID=481309 RepID=A0ABR3HZJ0_LOXSC